MSQIDVSNKILPRIGQIDFSNCLPINLPIQKSRVKVHGDFVSMVPSQLNKLILEDKLDISAVSLFCYLNSTKLDLVPGISVSSLGEVGSVLFFYKGELEDLDDKPLLVPNSSATSINLLSILLNKEANVTPRQISVASPDLLNENTYGALVIGDYALKVDRKWSQTFNRIDLGKWWYDNYNLPMVFGVWAARSDYVAENPLVSKEIFSALNKSRDLGLTVMLKDVVTEAVKHMQLSTQRVEKYFTEELDYTLSKKHLESIELYRNLCDELNLFDSLEELKEFGLKK